MRLPPLTSKHEVYIGGVVVATLNPPPGTYPALEINHEKGIGGWWSNTDADDAEIDSPPGIPAERPYSRTPRGKTLTYNLQQAEGPGDDYRDLTAHLNQLQAALQDISSLAALAVTPWEWPEPVPTWVTLGKILDFDADELQAYPATRQPTPWIRDPIFSFRMLSGRWLWWNESGVLMQPMTFSATPGVGVAVTNSGLAPNNPVVTVHGVAAGQDVHIGRDLPGGGTVDLWFRKPGAGDLRVDFNLRKAFIGLNDVTKTRDAGASSWWNALVPGVPPGTHNIFRGPGAGTGITVDLFSADF